ncbi:MAG: helix-turn-helix domain-containing protein [Cyanobacteria bacterium]|nr:helix-turn-helix domain-containing protein [Cyanobacteriota bacterium]
MDLGLQVKQVATQLGADEQSVSGWELGHRQPGLRHLPPVIHWLGYDPRPQSISIGAWHSPLA